MSSTLIIAEKPIAAARIAKALSTGKIEKTQNAGVNYYKIKRNSETILVASAVGHIFSLKQAGKKGWTYPIFDIEWKPSFEVNKSNKYTERYYKNIKSLSKKAEEFVIACDYDIEGSVIGFNVLRFACKKSKAKRMKFSTLTQNDLIEAYEKASNRLDKGMIEAGLTRHYMDWYYGINLSRALTISIKKASGMYKTLSTGRVQGPSLFILAEREKEIRRFVPVPFWQIHINLLLDDTALIAKHKTDVFWKKDEADSIFVKLSGDSAKVEKITRKKFKHPVPTPFDLTTLQTEAYRLFGYAPTLTQEIAQGLYESGLISYPRTSSQKLPDKLGFKDILEKLKGQNKYFKMAHELLQKKDLKPKEGAKQDPAHPAIYPTGEMPKFLTDNEKNLYDLIVKRFFSVFGKDAIRESLTVEFNYSEEPFLAHGKRTVEPNWHLFYAPYVRLDEITLPEMAEGGVVNVSDKEMLDKETQPPKRYTQASIIRKLEKENIGTKATRANIIETLEKRGYISGKSIEVTDLGLTVADTLGKYSPKILDIELTREFETLMEKIQANETDKEVVLDKVRSTLSEILDEFKKKEDKIGNELAQAVIKTRQQAKIIGKCDKCDKGQLKIIVSKATQKRFIGCTNYPNCRNAFPIPQSGDVLPTKLKCKDCTLPLIKVKQSGRKPWNSCISPDCPGKKLKKES